MKEKVDLKVCGVCGDKALGYNFNAVTCESCKAFFRRNALLQKDFVCPFNQHCEITTVTRRFCQKCRLDKCFSIGMRKDLIMSEQDKILKRRKIEENRSRKRMKEFKAGFKKVKKENLDSDLHDGDNFSPLASTDSDSSKEMSSPEQQHSASNSNYMQYNFNNSSVDDEANLFRQNERLMSFCNEETLITPSVMKNNSLPGSPYGHCNEEKNSSLLSTLINNNTAPVCTKHHPDLISNDRHFSGVSGEATKTRRKSVDVTRDVLQDVQRVSVEPNSIESILCEAIKLEFQAYSPIGKCNSNSRELNDAERAKLNELIVANKALTPPLDDDLGHLISSNGNFQGNSQNVLDPDPALVDVINLTAVVIRRLIKMAKKINAFKNMCQEDQVALLKGGCTEIMILRSAMNYDPKKQTWKIPHSQENLNLNVGILKLAKGNVYQEHERFIQSFDPKWRTDENIVLILCAITLFTPDRPKVVHQDVVKLEQNSYYYLLRRYLESIYPGCEAKSTFLKLIQTISELHKFNEELINVYLDVNPTQVEPLLLEIFDLKH